MHQFRHRPSRRTLTCLTALSVLAALTSCGGSSLSDSTGAGGNSDGPISIGLSIPLSGVYASLGEDMKQGFDLYLKEHGDKLGGRAIKVVTADEGEGPPTGVPATTKLVSQDRVSAVVGLVNSATALGLKDTFVQSKVPLIVANAGADGITKDASPYIWRVSFTNGSVGEALGGQVAEDVAGGGVYLLAAGYAAGKESVAGFKKSFTAAGGKVAGESYTPFGTTSDWQPYLSKIKASGAKAVYVFYAGAEAVNFVKQYSAFGLGKQAQLYGAGFLTEGGVLTAQGAAAAGVKTSLHYSDQLDSATNKTFVEAYTQAYKEPPTVYAVQAYDAAAVLDKAIKNAATTDGVGLSEAIAKVGDVESPRGTWKFDSLHDPSQPYFLRQVKLSGSAYVNAVIGNLTP